VHAGASAQLRAQEEPVTRATAKSVKMLPQGWTFQRNPSQRSLSEIPLKNSQRRLQGGRKQNLSKNIVADNAHSHTTTSEISDYHAAMPGPTPEQLAASGSELAHQTALFCWAALNTAQWPELRLLFSIPNEGLRSMRLGGQLKAAGMRSGVPDIFLPVARSGKHGLWIEMTVMGNRTTPQQDQWLCELANEGYSVCVAFSWIEARELILEYLTGRF